MRLEHPLAASTAALASVTDIVSIPDVLRAPLLALVSAVLAWITSWVIGRIKKALGG